MCAAQVEAHLSALAKEACTAALPPAEARERSRAARVALGSVPSHKVSPQQQRNHRGGHIAGGGGEVESLLERRAREAGEAKAARRMAVAEEEAEAARERRAHARAEVRVVHTFIHY